MESATTSDITNELEEQDLQTDFVNEPPAAPTTTIDDKKAPASETANDPNDSKPIIT